MSIAEWETLEGQVFPIRDPVDIIALRMEVRQIVRKAGLGLVDQSSFSIATSNLAYKIGMASRPGGSVKIGWRSDGSKSRVRLMMMMPVEPDQILAKDVYEDIHNLVNRLDIHTTNENVMIVDMEKWAVG